MLNLFKFSLVRQVAECMLEFCEYIFFGAAILLVVFLVFKNFPRDVFRKLLHLIAFSSLVEMTIAARSWQAASISALLFAAVVYPLLCLVEKYEWYGRLFVQKAPGEVKKSLLLLFIMYAALTAICWGLLDERFIGMTAVLMWGVGDAAAALIGRRFGRHPATLPLADTHKTFEGSAAMMVFAFAAGVVGLLLTGEYPVGRCVLYPLIAAPVAAYTELITKNGDDTVTVPVATAIALTAASKLF